MKKKRTALKGIIIAIVVIIALFLSLIGFITDFLWFKELGYVSVFLTKLFTMLKIGIPVFIVVSLLAYVYLKFLKKGYFKKIESTEITDTKRLNRTTWILAAIFGLLVAGTSVVNLWFEALKFANSTGFDITDPLFKLDISFYLFKLPFIQELAQLIIGVIIAFAILTVVYYSILLSVRTPQVFEEAEPEEPFKDPFAEEEQQDPNMGFDNVTDLFGKFGEAFTGRKAKPKKKAKKQFDNDNFHQLLNIAEKQLILVGILFFVMVAVNLFLKQFDLLYGHTGTVYGAGFTDVNITLWVYRIMAVLSLAAAVTFAIGVTKRKIKTIAVLPIAIIVVGLVGTGAGMLVQNFVVSPDELSKESKYLEYNIEYTQYAYDLQDVTIKPFKASSDLTSEDIANNDETINNIRINDYDPAQKFYNQTQAIRQYYNFTDVDVDRYMINGEYTQTFLSAREINEEDISQTWLNTHLKYTHGYGITLSRVDQVTSSGQPDMLISNIPPESSIEEIQITQPGIYFGESTNNYVLTNTDEAEFDYPDGETNNKYTTYEGSAGIKMNAFNKLMFSIRERSLKLLVSSNIDSDSKIIINRNIMNRVQQIMPYLSYDDDPYIVTADGGLYWIIDAYTASNRYPYSEPYDVASGMNYVRNSVKVVINAYTGETNYYLVDNEDPIANTYKEIYPKLFKDFEEMPESLQSHIRYPNQLFTVQANVYKKYHMTDVNIFYQSEDMWEIAEEIYGTEPTSMTPNYYILKLPGEKSAEFVNSIAYTPKNKKNMTGLLMARNDGEDYGELVLYQMPKSKIVYGPRQIEALIDQNTEISKEFSLWDSAGSTYSRGNLFIIPIEDSLIYVEPVYLEAKEDSIPEVKRVIVAYGDKIAYESTLAEALNSLFGEGSAEENKNAGSDSGKKTDDQLTQSEIIEKAQEAFNNAEAAQQEGDWAKYGKYLDELEKYLGML